MARQVKEVTIDGRIIKVKEFTVREIRQFWSDFITPPATDKDAMAVFGDGLLKKHWGIAIEGITIEETEDLPPSELKRIYDAFRETNNVFFDLTSQLGEDPVGGMLQRFRLVILNDLMAKYAALLQAVTEPQPGTTDIVSS